MGVTTKVRVDDALGLTQTFWAPMFDKELRQNTLWSAVLQDPNISPSKVVGGDTLKISYLNKPTSTIRSIGSNADSFDAAVLSSTQIDLVVDRRAVSAYEFEDLAILMSQLESEDSQIRAALMADVRQQVNDFIKSRISAGTTQSSVTDYGLAALSVTRTTAASKYWSPDEPWYAFLSPSYYSDLLDDTTLTAADAMGISESPAIKGKFALQRMGFNIIEDNSLGTDIGYAFLPSFMKVLIGEPRFKLSDLHANKQFGYVLSVDVPVACKQLDSNRVIAITA